MRSISEIRESPNFQRLKNSIEYKTELRNVMVIGGVFGTLSLIILLIGENTGIGVIYALMCAGLIIYQIYRLLRIFSCMDSYTYTETILDHPRQGFRGAMYFTVRVRNRFGKEIDVDTNHIFSRAEPNFEDYLNQKVLIGYNNDTELVVVIKKLSS